MASLAAFESGLGPGGSSAAVAGEPISVARRRTVLFSPGGLASRGWEDILRSSERGALAAVIAGESIADPFRKLLA